MELKIETQQSWALVYLEGRMDSFNYELITNKISTLAKMGKKNIAIVVKNANFLSLPCLRFFSTFGLKLKRKQGVLAFIGADNAVLKDLSSFNIEDNYIFINSTEDLRDYEKTKN